MAYDYVNIKIDNPDIDFLKNSKKFDFIREVSESTGEIKEKMIAEYHHCKIIIYDSGSVYFKGSIHKLWNSINGVKAPNYKENKKDTGFNGNLFTLKDILFVIEHLKQILGCSSQQMKIIGAESGINAVISFCPQMFIKGLLYHKGTPFETRFKGNLAEVIFQRYKIKIYNKSSQYGMNCHVLRFEINYNRSVEIEKFGITSFFDVNEHTLNKVLNELFLQFKKVMYYDYTIDQKRLTNTQKVTALNYSRSQYWLNELLPKNRDKHKKKLARFINDYSKNLRRQIQDEIIRKGVMINQYSLIEDGVIINNSNTMLSVTPMSLVNKRVCSVTGLNISMQKDNSVLLSHTGLYYYYTKDEKTFNQIKQKHLSTKWINADLKTQIKELAHNIRNSKNNRKLKMLRLYPTNQFNLLNIIPKEKS